MSDPQMTECVAEAKAWKEAYDEAERLWDEFADAREDWLVDGGTALVACSPPSLVTGGLGGSACALTAAKAWKDFWETKEKQQAANDAAQRANDLLDVFNECYCNPKIPWKDW